MYQPPSPPPAAPPNWKRMGAMINMVAGFMVGIGIIALAFSLGRVEVSNFQTGTYTGGVPPPISFTVSSAGYTIGVLLVGIGAMLRGIGGMVSAAST